VGIEEIYFSMYTREILTYYYNCIINLHKFANPHRTKHYSIDNIVLFIIITKALKKTNRYIYEYHNPIKYHKKHKEKFLSHKISYYWYN